MEDEELRRMLKRFKLVSIAFGSLSVVVVAFAQIHSIKKDSLIPMMSIYQIIFGPLALLKDEYARYVFGKNWAVVMTFLCIILVPMIFSRAAKQNIITGVLTVIGVFCWFFIGLVISTSGLGV